MIVDAPSSPAEAIPEARLKAFLRDQVEAVAILREERADERVTRRMDAVHVALRYLESQQPSEHHSPTKVVAVAKTFERYLLEP